VDRYLKVIFEGQYTHDMGRYMQYDVSGIKLWPAFPHSALGNMAT
jgi:hypothetical protein